jgi:uncharacterized alpha/beta hydrolase family protein
LFSEKKRESDLQKKRKKKKVYPTLHISRYNFNSFNSLIGRLMANFGEKETQMGRLK